MDAELKLTEAKDNHTETKILQDFLEFCIQYLEGNSGMIVDMPFLERIKEGEIRILMLRDKVMNVVHKKPASSKDAFSATLFLVQNTATIPQKSGLIWSNLPKAWSL